METFSSKFARSASFVAATPFYFYRALYLRMAASTETAYENPGKARAVTGALLSTAAAGLAIGGLDLADTFNVSSQTGRTAFALLWPSYGFPLAARGLFQIISGDKSPLTEKAMRDIVDQTRDIKPH